MGPCWLNFFLFMQAAICSYLRCCILFKKFSGLVQTNQSKTAMISPVEGSNFTVSFDTVVNYRPSAVWYKDGIIIQQNDGFNFTDEIIGKLANFTIYRYSIFKEVAHRTDSGYYNGFITFGGRQYHYTNSTVLVKCKSKILSNISVFKSI